MNIATTNNKAYTQSFIKFINSKLFLYPISFLIPATFLIFIFNNLDICPFGSSAPLVIDMNGQYIDFLSYFKTIITGNNNFLYSFSEGLGGNFFGFSAYYLLSPFNFITIFFSEDMLPIAASLIILLKISFSGLSFNIFLNSNCKDKYNLTSLIFSTAYALMSYNTVYYYTIIWLDGIILLPLVIMGINRILDTNKGNIYLVFLFISFVTSYYIGFMIFIFSNLYFIYRLICSDSFKVVRVKKCAEIKTYILSTLFACGFAMFLFLPVILSLLGSKIQTNLDIRIFELILFLLFVLFCLSIFLIFKHNKNNPKKEIHGCNSKLLSPKFVIILSSCTIIFLLLYIVGPLLSNQYEIFSIFKENLRIGDVLSKLYTSSFNIMQLNNWDFPQTALPQIFSGMLTVLLVFLYFFNSNFKKREKIFSAMLILIFIISFCIEILGLIWHGFSKPIWFPARFSFLFSFFLIYLAYTSFSNFKSGINDKRLILGTCTFIATSVLIYFSSKAIKTFSNSTNIFLNIGLVVLFSLILYLFIITKKSPQIKSTMLIFLLAVLHFSNIYYDAFSNIKETQENSNKISTCSTLPQYQNFVSQTGNIINEVKQQDASFYRMEKTYFRSINDPMQFNFNGLSHFSSSEKAFSRVFLETLGFKNNGNMTHYNCGYTCSIDSLLGIKYLISDSNNTFKPYKTLSANNSLTVNANPFALSLGFMSNSKIAELKFDRNNINPFENQNTIFKSISDSNFGDVFTPIKSVVETSQNLKKSKLGDYIKYDKMNPDEEAFISYKLKKDNKNNLFAYFGSPKTDPTKSSKIEGVKIFINDRAPEEYKFYDGFNCILPLSLIEENTIEFKIYVQGDSFRLNNALFCAENIDILSNYYNIISKESAALTKVSSSKIEGTIDVTSNENYLLLTIPYEEGWTIYIDGNKAEKIRILDTLTAVKITAGRHKIEMNFIPDGLHMGIFISILVFLIFIVYSLFNCRKNKNNQNNLC